jgi:cholest-4-en-3-one 26-monooxygenase
VLQPWPLAEDISSPDTFVRGVPYEIFAELRKNAPVAWCVGEDGAGFWSVTRHADVSAVSRDPKRFSSGAYGTTPEEAQLLVLINMDPPAHTRYRQLVSKGFSPRAVQAMEPVVRERAKRLVARLLESGDVDFVTDVAAHLPLQVICDLMGIPDEDQPMVLRWSNRLIASDDPELNETPAAVDEAQAAAFGYFLELAAQRRGQPGDDLISILVHAELDGTQLTELELGLFCILLLIGGNETTRNTLAHGLLALIEHPEELARLVERPELSELAADEILRHSSALMQFTRIATTDTSIAGVPIAEGDQLRLWYASANRDESVFDAPERFHVRRDPNPLLTFGGGGPHICLGSSLARLQVRVMFEELLPHIGAMELTGPPARLRSNFVNGIKHLPLRMAPGGA